MINTGRGAGISRRHPESNYAAPRRSPAQAVWLVGLCRAAKPLIIRGRWLAGLVCPFLNPVRELDAGDDKNHRDHDLDGIGENPEVTGKIVGNHVSLRIRYSTTNVPTIPASLWPGTLQ